VLTSFDQLKKAQVAQDYQGFADHRQNCVRFLTLNSCHVQVKFLLLLSLGQIE
jgi:hypothetical protein